MPSTRSLDVLVIGAGQAGLALGYHLSRTHLTFLLVDAAPELGFSWRSRWDSLRLFSPAQYDSLPGMAFPAPADSHPSKDDVADYLVAYAERFQLPVRTSSPVLTLRRDEDGWFEAATPTELLHGRAVVVATGPFQLPHTPGLSAGFDPQVRQLHSADYRNPGQLPSGARVLVVGAANSGLQIASDLAERFDVSIAIGSTPMTSPQRIAGRDLFFWLVTVGFFALPAESRIARRLQQRGDLIIGSSRRTLRRSGVMLRPRLTGASGRTARFADQQTSDFDAVVWATGYKADYSWLQIAGVLDGDRIRHHGGGTAVAGLNFVGLPWQTSRGSALLGFVGADAGSLAAPLVTEAAAGTPPPGATARRRHRHPRRAQRSALGASRLREPDTADAPMGEERPLQPWRLSCAVDGNVRRTYSATSHDRLVVAIHTRRTESRAVGRRPCEDRER